MIGLTGGDGTADASGNLRAADWFYRSKAASVLWLVARLWLGYGWLSAGYQKLWGSEKAVFWNGGGAGVKGFATAGVAGSAAGKGPARPTAGGRPSCTTSSCRTRRGSPRW